MEKHSSNPKAEGLLRQSRYWSTSHMLRTLAWSDTEIKRVFYFNLTFACNSKCIFCASDNLLDTKPSVTYKQISEAFECHNLQKGDLVVLNGGEATLINNLNQIIELASIKNAYVVLFTNGRLLKDPNLASEILKKVNRVTIPLYSTDQKIHNKLTGSVNGLQETYKGINNILLLRKKNLCKTEIELKCLTIKPSLFENPNIVVTCFRKCDQVK